MFGEPGHLTNFSFAQKKKNSLQKNRKIKEDSVCLHSKSFRSGGCDTSEQQQKAL
jgi:hypothetical protein